MRFVFLLCCLLLSCLAYSAELADLSAELQDLVKQLESENDKERKAAAKALGKMKEVAQPALPWITKRMDSEDSVWVKKELRGAIKRIGVAEEAADSEDAAAANLTAGKHGEDGYRLPLPNPKKSKARIVYSPDGIGKAGNNGSKAKIEDRKIEGLKNNNTYKLIHFTGKEWSGYIINWAEFWDKSPLKVNPSPKQNTHMVLRCLYLGRPGDINLTVAIQVEAGEQSEFLRISNYDPKHTLQKSAHFVDIEIPLADFHRSMPEADREKFIWGVHFGNMSHQNEKDMGLLLKHIAFIKK